MSEPDVDAPPEKRNYKILLIKSCSYFMTGTIVLLTAVQLYSWLGPTSLPDCDDSSVQGSLRSIFSEKANYPISVMDAFTPGAKAANSLSCTADLTFNDKSRGHLSYRVYLQEGHVMVVTDELKEL